MLLRKDRSTGQLETHGVHIGVMVVSSKFAEELTTLLSKVTAPGQHLRTHGQRQSSTLLRRLRRMTSVTIKLLTSFPSQLSKLVLTL